MVVYDFLPSPRWGEGLGVRGEAPATSQDPLTPTLSPAKPGERETKGEARLGPSAQSRVSHRRNHATSGPVREDPCLVFRLFTEGLAPFGFSPFGATIYFIRDRGPVRDALFIQKMRSNTLTIAYGVSIPPKDGPWSPGLLRARWLNKHEFFNVKSEEHARRSVAPRTPGISARGSAMVRAVRECC